jgi:hypothetical protein
MRRLATALILLGAGMSAGAALAQGRANVPATCSRDLFQNEAGLRQQQTRLTSAATADQATQCRVWREHVAFLQKSRAVFATCQSGAQREQNVGLMDSDLADYRVLLRDRCRR